MEENKEMLELLRKIEKSSRAQARTGTLVCIFALIAAVSCVAALMLVLDFLPQIHAVLEQMQTVLGNLEQTTAQLASMDLQSMVSNVDALVATGQEGLEQTMEKLNSIDLDTLNKAIGDLAKVVEPLARLISRRT